MPRINRKVENIKAVATLLIITLIAAVILGLVYTLTKIDETQRLKDKISESYDSPLLDTKFDISGYNNLQYCQILEVFEASDSAMLILSRANNSYSADGIELIVIIKDAKIIKVVKYKSAETPGLGSKATDESYLSKYNDISVDKIKPSEKNIVDNVTGATRSSNAVRFAIEAAADVYLYLKEGGR